MSEFKKEIEAVDEDLLRKMVMDALRRTMVHYGFWLGEVVHQLGMEKALKVEQNVWTSSLKNQMNRLGKTLGFQVEDGMPTVLKTLPRETLVGLLENLGINWLANDGIWFQGVESQFNMNDAKRCNDSCWSRFSPYEAARIKELLDLPENGGLAVLKKALGYRLYALINDQSIEEVDDNTIIFRMNSCRVQTARKRRGLPDYPCKTGIPLFSC